MAHAVETAYFADRPAWHGHGVTVEGARTWRAAMEIADALWEVEKHPAYALVPVITADGVSNHYVPMDGRYAVTRTLRDGSVRVLGDVGEQWTPFQNVEAGEFLDTLVDAGELRFESVLVLHGGRVIVLLARTPNDLVIGDGDRVRPYIGLVNSHDGSMALSVREFQTRIVCANTLAVGLRERTPNVWKVRHTGNLRERLEEARRTLKLHTTYNQAWAEEMHRLLDQPFSQADYAGMVKELFPVDRRRDRKREDPNVDRRAVMLANYHRTRTVSPAMLATKYGAFNVATEALEHLQKVRGRKGYDKGEVRLIGSLFGQIADQRQQVYAYLIRN